METKTPKTQNTPVNIDEVNNILSNQLRAIDNGKVHVDVANAASNLAGKMISGVKVQMYYNKVLSRPINSPRVKAFLEPESA